MSEYFVFVLSVVSPSVLHLPAVTTVSLDIGSLAKERTAHVKYIVHLMEMCAGSHVAWRWYKYVR